MLGLYTNNKNKLNFTDGTNSSYIETRISSNPSGCFYLMKNSASTSTIVRRQCSAKDAFVMCKAHFRPSKFSTNDIATKISLSPAAKKTELKRNNSRERNPWNSLDWKIKSYFDQLEENEAKKSNRDDGMNSYAQCSFFFVAAEVRLCSIGSHGIYHCNETIPIEYPRDTVKTVQFLNKKSSVERLKRQASSSVSSSLLPTSNDPEMTGKNELVSSAVTDMPKETATSAEKIQTPQTNLESLTDKDQAKKADLESIPTAVKQQQQLRNPKNLTAAAEARKNDDEEVEVGLSQISKSKALKMVKKSKVKSGVKESKDLKAMDETTQGGVSEANYDSEDAISTAMTDAPIESDFSGKNLHYSLPVGADKNLLEQPETATRQTSKKQKIDTDYANPELPAAASNESYSTVDDSNLLNPIVSTEEERKDYGDYMPGTVDYEVNTEIIPDEIKSITNPADSLFNGTDLFKQSKTTVKGFISEYEDSSDKTIDKQLKSDLSLKASNDSLPIVNDTDLLTSTLIPRKTVVAIKVNVTSYNDAANLCKKHFDSELASIGDANEYKALKEILQKNHPFDPSSTYLFGSAITSKTFAARSTKNFVKENAEMDEHLRSPFNDKWIPDMILAFAVIIFGCAIVLVAIRYLTKSGPKALPKYRAIVKRQALRKRPGILIENEPEIPMKIPVPNGSRSTLEQKEREKRKVPRRRPPSKSLHGMSDKRDSYLSESSDEFFDV
uniref:THAP-type domain-containing protein n=1 Tax=Syphacia muris TaxID=451379 RepID=A0A158R5B7_9BILA